MDGSEIWISFRWIWISFRQTLILFRVVLISFRRILNSFHLEVGRGGVGVAALQIMSSQPIEVSGPAAEMSRSRFRRSG